MYVCELRLPLLLNGFQASIKNKIENAKLKHSNQQLYVVYKTAKKNKQSTTKSPNYNNNKSKISASFFF